jgi:predicted Zn-dependent protease
VNRGDEAGRDRALEAARRVLGPRPALDAFWTQLLSMAPDPVQPQESLDRCTRGYAAMMDGQWIDAQREQLSALRYAPRFHWCLAGVAETTWRLGDAARGEQLLRRVIADYPAAQEPLRADAKGRLAALLLDGKRGAGEAARLLREALAVRGERRALLQRLEQACEAIDDDACERDAEARLARLGASAR